MATTAFFAFLALVIIEMILSASLSRLYFRVGFPLFVYRVAIDFPDRSLPSSEDLTALLPESVFTRLLIGEIGDGQFAVREKFWGGLFRIDYTPVMHGLLSFDVGAKCVRLTGFANLFPFAFLAAIILSASSDGFFDFFIGAVITILALAYLIQARRYISVTKAAAAAWERRAV